MNLTETFVNGADLQRAVKGSSVTVCAGTIQDLLRYRSKPEQ